VYSTDSAGASRPGRPDPHHTNVIVVESPALLEPTSPVIVRRPRGAPRLHHGAGFAPSGGSTSGPGGRESTTTPRTVWPRSTTPAAAPCQGSASFPTSFGSGVSPARQRGTCGSL